MIKEENDKLGISLNQGTSFLFGHDKQIKFILDRIKASKIPNAWLFHGPMGVGKASLALNVAKVLSGSHDMHDSVIAVHKEDCEELHLGSYKHEGPEYMKL